MQKSIQSLAAIFSVVFLASPASAAAEDFTPDFAAFLAQNFPGADFSGHAAGVNSGFGGRAAASDPVDQTPIVFVHGTTDRALGGQSGGWTAVINDFLARGYGSQELYALTWGNGTQASAIQNVHDAGTVLKVRKFIEAVLAYTGAPKIHVVGHSMGVTLARRAIKGGNIEGHEIGAALTERVDTFLGIAGANSGVGSCLNPFAEFLPMCSRVNGLHPESRYLADLNSDPTREAAHVYVFWSDADEVLNGTVIGHDNPVPASVTTKIPGQDGEFAFTGLSHLGTRDETLATLRNLLH